MWIKEPNYPISKSLNLDLNFLFTNGEGVYVMDNHLAATWCWLQEIDVNQAYHYYHIDQHYDLVDDPVGFKEHILEERIELHELSLEQYISIEQAMPVESRAVPLFRWDNYIAFADMAYPKMFGRKLFATHELSGDCKYDGFISEEIRFDYLIDNIKNEIKYRSDFKWIFNIDLDYFFSNSNNGHLRVFTDEFVKNIIGQLKELRDQISVLTICMSPECCGGWKNSYNVLEIFLRELDLDLELDLARMKDD